MAISSSLNVRRKPTFWQLWKHLEKVDIYINSRLQDHHFSVHTFYSSRMTMNSVNKNWLSEWIYSFLFIFSLSCLTFLSSSSLLIYLGFLWHFVTFFSNLLSSSVLFFSFSFSLTCSFFNSFPLHFLLIFPFSCFG